MASSSRDSRVHETHAEGGWRYLGEPTFQQQNSFRFVFSGDTYLSHPLQKYSCDCFGIPSVMSTCVRKHATHVLAGLGSIGVPHWQQRLGIQGEEREREGEREGGRGEREQSK